MDLARKFFYITGWTGSIVLVCVVVGAMAVMFPPMASIGAVALVAVILLWAAPELRGVPDNALRKFFFVMVVVLLCLPPYYALTSSFLPWISIRRIFETVVIILFCITIAGSASAREKILETSRNSRWLAFCSIGFLAMIFLSIFTSTNWLISVKELTDSLLNWYVPLFACILVIRSDKDANLFLKIIAVSSLVVSSAGIIEFMTYHKVYFDILPKSILDPMLSDNPLALSIYEQTLFRNGLYRSVSLYNVPLSFGEFAAMTAPIGAYFLFDGKNIRERILGFATVVFSVIALFCSGARGGFVAFLVAMPTFLFLWTYRYSKLNPRSLIGATIISFSIVGVVTVFGLILSSTRLYNIVLGGDDSASSNDARIAQWQLALPHIVSNPITGHGAGLSGEVIDYHLPDGTVTVDTYVLSLLVEVGLPGLLFFFGMIAVGVFIGARLYLSDLDKRATIGAPIACSLLAFAVYRLTLSQRENHILFFLLIGLVFAVSKIAYDRRSKYARVVSSNFGGSHRDVTSRNGKAAPVRFR